jgi:hypothetical protein
MSSGARDKGSDQDNIGTLVADGGRMNQNRGIIRR